MAVVLRFGAAGFLDGGLGMAGGPVEGVGAEGVAVGLVGGASAVVVTTPPLFSGSSPLFFSDFGVSCESGVLGRFGEASMMVGGTF